MKHTIKRSLCRLLALWTLLLALCSGVFAAAEDDAQALCTLDVFRGTGGSFAARMADPRKEYEQIYMRTVLLARASTRPHRTAQADGHGE